MTRDATNSTNPYNDVPPTSRWNDVVANLPAHAIDPTLPGRFAITQKTRIASAGSCFAQNISRALEASGYTYVNEEPGPAFLSEQERRANHYGVYSARYGNVYTVRQLLQLYRRAFSQFTPAEKLWRLPNGHFVDPFRPGVQSAGFESEEECLWDRQNHLKAVQRVFTGLDVFIFTLGLTEAWCSRDDGAVFPLPPGSARGGTYDPALYQFHNFSVSEIVDDLSAFIQELNDVNPKASIIFTVSPVPLIATFEPRHVLQATVYSKSVLRVAVEQMREKFQNVDYFPAFEIVMNTADASVYFAADRRSVSPLAIEHVMTCFGRQFLSSPISFVPASSTDADRTREDMNSLPLCDEDAVLENLARAARQS